MSEGKVCIAFDMENAVEARNHIIPEMIEDYGHRYGDKILHTWDDGHRALFRCKACGGYYLAQFSEFHGSENDSYYADYFPVSGPEEARLINEKYDGEDIEEQFPERWMICDGKPFWNNGARDPIKKT